MTPPGPHAMTAQAGAVAWRCDGRFPEGDGGVTHITKYAKTRQEMLIFRDQGYTCTPLHDEPAAVPVEALEGLLDKAQFLVDGLDEDSPND